MRPGFNYDIMALRTDTSSKSNVLDRWAFLKEKINMLSLAIKKNNNRKKILYTMQIVNILQKLY